jgi:hypothetical protein
MDRQERPDVATASEGLADCDWRTATARRSRTCMDLARRRRDDPGRPPRRVRQAILPVLFQRPTFYYRW